MSGVPSLRNQSNIDDNGLGRELAQFCGSDQLSLDHLREKIALIPPHIVTNSNALHHACLNKKVTLGIVQCLLEACPGAAEVTMDSDGAKSPYPLHLACYNESCPSSVIELLVKEYPSALRQFRGDPNVMRQGGGVQQLVGGLPLHYYLSRTLNMEIETIKISVDAYPEGLKMKGEDSAGSTPPETLLHNKSIANLNDVVPFIGRATLHVACDNTKLCPRTIQLLLDCWPESISQQNDGGTLPIHVLCGNDNLDETTSVNILALLIKASPVSVHHMGRWGESGKCLPIHMAAEHNKSPEFCKLLVDAYPDSLNIASEDGELPIHYACMGGRVDTVKYLLELHPGDINRRSGFGGRLPIHLATECRKTETIRFLLMQDPAAATKTTEYLQLPLHMACRHNHSDISILQLLFDSYPEAIYTTYEGRTPLYISELNMQNTNLINFLQLQMSYADMARDTRAMTTLDDNGRLPLHQALNENATLGAIKLLLEGNPTALGVADNQGVQPLHIACDYSSPGVVKFLVARLNDDDLNRCDENSDFLLHHACRSGHCDAAKVLLERGVSSVSKWNGNNKLPVHLLCESDRADRRRCEYGKTDIVKILFDSYPEAIYTTYEGRTPLGIARCRRGRARNPKLIQFLETQMTYARTAQDTRAMTTLDDNGWLPLHQALNDNVTLGVIKLFVKSNPSALTVADNQGVLPLHIACEFSFPGVVKFLVTELNDDDLNRCDENEDSPLHFACRGGNCDAAKVLLERGVSSVSKWNGNNKLPVHLLCESDNVDCESPEYVETIWLLLLAYPETVLDFD